MTIQPFLAHELSRASSPARSRLRARAVALCWVVLPINAIACGSIEKSEDVAELGPSRTTIDEARGASTPTQRTPTETATAVEDTDPSAVSERDREDITRSGSSASRTRGGGAARPRVSEIPSDERDIDGGDIDADAGDVDAGFDAGDVEVDAGDAGASR